MKHASSYNSLNLQSADSLLNTGLDHGTRFCNSYSVTVTHVDYMQCNNVQTSDCNVLLKYAHNTYSKNHRESMHVT